VYQGKSDYIRTNKLVVMRFRDNWDARIVNGQLAGLAKALAWDRYHSPVKGAKNFYRPGNNYFQLPPAPLGKAIAHLQDSLHVKTMRVMGDKTAVVSRTALLPGYVLVSDLQAAYAHGGVDLVVAGEAVEWEGVEYLQDMIAAKRTKAAVLLGSEVSEEPGSGEMAAWLKSFLRVPVEWIPAGEPFTRGM
jgi:putative NIF3 family GTP cyclohydrolase 1 type 2